MSKLHGVGRTVARQHGQEVAQQRCVIRQRRRTLKQHATESVAEQLAARHERRDVLADVLELLPVGDLLTRLQREDEALRRLGAPLLHRLLAREPPERVVDLDRRQLRGVVVQHVVLLEILWVEDALAPLLVGEPGGPEVEAAGHAVHHGMSPSNVPWKEPSLLLGYEDRPGSAADLDTVIDLVRRAEIDDHGRVTADWEAIAPIVFGSPGFAWADDSLVVERAGEAVAFTGVFSDDEDGAAPFRSWLVCDAAHQEAVVPSLIDWDVARARQRDVRALRHLAY